MAIFFSMMVSALVPLAILRNLTVLSSAQVSLNAVFQLFRKSLIGIPRTLFHGLASLLTLARAKFMRLMRESKAFFCDLKQLCADFEVSASIHVIRLAPIVGRIISLSPCCGNVTQIIPRYFHLIVNSRDSQHSIVFIQFIQFEKFKWCRWLT